MSRPIRVEIIAKRNENPESLIKKFIKKVKKEGIIDEIRERKYYKKPSVLRREKAVRRKYMIQKLNEERKRKNEI